MQDPKPILDYRQPGHDPQASLDKVDRVLVKLALGFIVVFTVIVIVLSFV